MPRVHRWPIMMMRRIAVRTSRVDDFICLKHALIQRFRKYQASRELLDALAMVGTIQDHASKSLRGITDDNTYPVFGVALPSNLV